MKKLLKFSLFVLVFVIFIHLLPMTECEAATSSKLSEKELSQVITFHSKAIEKEVRKLLNKADGSITRKDALEITDLTLREQELSDISDLKNFTNLNALDLSYNKLDNIKDLAQLKKLRILLLYGNNITSISSLKSCTELEHLDFSDNQVEDISVLGSLVNLEKLYFENNKVTDIYVIKKLVNLTILYMDDNYFEDYSSILGLNKLNALHICNSMIKDYKPLDQISKQLRDKDFDIDRDTAVADKVTQAIKQIITPDMSDYEKEKAVNDYIVLHTVYDYDNYEKDTIPRESYTVYGIMLKGTGVCDGYAHTFKYFMDRLGIECYIVGGPANGAHGWEGHAWNIVKIEGEYYQIDVTWNDPAPDTPGKVRYDYFNINDAQIQIDHHWDVDNYPKCTAVKYNYDYYNVCKEAGVSPDSPSYITGTISLPQNNYAPKDGVQLQIGLYSNISSDKKTFNNKQYLVTIPRGESSISYSIAVPNTNYKYRMQCSVTPGYQYESGVYTTSGLNSDYDKNTPITPTSNTGIDFTLRRKSDALNEFNVRISLPEDVAAPKGGLKVSLCWGTKTSESTKDAVIPEGKEYVEVPCSLYQSDTEEYFLYYYLKDVNDRYLGEGFYSTKGMTSDISKASTVQFYNGSDFSLELIKGKGTMEIQGKVSLPKGETAPKGGISLTLTARSEGVTSDYVLDDFSYTAKVIIPQGKKSADYKLSVATTATGYTMYYSIDSKIPGYVGNGYYSETGNQMSIRPQTLVKASNCSAVNFTLDKGLSASGKVSLPAGDTAPAGGVYVSIKAFSLNNTYDNFDDDVSNEVQAFIPEGKNSADYSMVLMPAASEYFIYYQIDNMPGTSFGDKYYPYGVNTKSGKVQMDVKASSTNVNLTIVRANKVTGTVSLPAGMTAPKAGMQVIIGVNMENGTPQNSYDDDTASEIFTIPEGAGSVEYSLLIPDTESKYYVTYSIMGDSMGCLERGYFGNSGISVESIDQAYMFDRAAERVINIVIVKK